ncbi:MAG: hypothetical protein HY744_19700 [Deltaproteobacteria bacterium]|nr:hypothetical protein [Deltaproteobacteria bacterium]
MAAVQIICFSWIFGLARGKKEAHAGAQIRIPGFMWAVMRYVAPVYVIVVFIGFCVQNMGESVHTIVARPAALLALGLVAAIAVALLVAVRLGEKRWRGEGLDIDDRNREEG